MTNEEFERKIEFIVNQQAQFAVDIQKLQEAQAVTTQDIANANKVAAHAAEAAAVTAETLTGFITATHDGFRYVFESFKHTDAKIDALVDSQMLTDEKIRDLTALVDRHIREGHHDHNGA